MEKMRILKTKLQRKLANLIFNKSDGNFLLILYKISKIRIEKQIRESE